MISAGQVSEVMLRLPDLYEPPFVRIVEQPSLHIIGDHLWHSSILLAQYILEGHMDESIGQGRQVLELGAGCGLVSLAVAARHRAQGIAMGHIIATDLPKVVASTLEGALNVNAGLSGSIVAHPLEWGTFGRESLPFTLAKPLTILASDVLYNADSHAILLETLQSLRGRGLKTGCSIFIAYRHRIAGDDEFWALAENASLAFTMVCQVADLQLWRHVS